MAQQVFPPGHATRKEDRQGGDGAALGDCSVLDVAQGVGLRASEKVRFERGPARTRPWCAVQHRVIDSAARSPFAGEFEVVMMIAGATEEMHGSDRVSCPELITSEPTVGKGNTFNESEMALFSEC